MGRHLTDYDAAMAFLFQMVDYEKVNRFKYSSGTFNLSRVEQLMDAAGGPHRKLNALHIAGTKGKGSVAMMAESMLRAHGLETGLYTQPHLVDLEERIRINGVPIPQAQTVALLDRLFPHVDDLRKKTPHESPTFFDLVTTAAFTAFVDEEVDIAVIEVGLGGRLDSTNVIRPAACTITRIDFDHVNQLGNTLDKIAREKAGIIKPGVPVACAPQAPEALQVIEAVCREREAPLKRVGHDAVVEKSESVLNDDVAGVRLTLRTRRRRFEDVVVPLLGLHQATNAATAALAVELLEDVGAVELDTDALRRGLTTVRCPGRIELIRGRPTTIVDAAHNVASATVLRSVLREHFAYRRMVVVLGVSRDKDVPGIVRTIAPLSASVICTKSDSPRAAEPADLLAEVCKHAAVQASAFEDATEALAAARKWAGPEDLIVITGSFFLAGLLRPLVVPRS